MDWNNIPGRPDPTHFPDIMSAAGNPKRKRRRKSPSSPGSARGRYKIVSYCPECERPVATSVGSTQVSGNCKNGHVWRLC